MVFRLTICSNVCVKLCFALLFASTYCQAELSDSVRDKVIDFVLVHEGGHVVYNGVDYNYGLSGTYHGDVKLISKDSARHVYNRLWIESNAARMGDSCMALVYFDTYIMFNPTTAKELLEGCYEPRTYLLRRLEKHCQMIIKYPDKKQFLLTWNRRIVDLFNLCQ
jgi:hypothetical protein